MRIHISLSSNDKESICVYIASIPIGVTFPEGCVNQNRIMGENSNGLKIVLNEILCELILYLYLTLIIRSVSRKESSPKNGIYL